MLQSKNTDFDMEIFFGTDNGHANWQSIFDITINGAVKHVVSFNKTQTTGSYLSSIKTIYATFLQNSTYINFF